MRPHSISYGAIDMGPFTDPLKEFSHVFRKIDAGLWTRLALVMFCCVFILSMPFKGYTSNPVPVKQPWLIGTNISEYITEIQPWPTLIINADTCQWNKAQSQAYFNVRLTATSARVTPMALNRPNVSGTTWMNMNAFIIRNNENWWYSHSKTKKH